MTLCAMIGCKAKEEKPAEIYLARVYNEYLYPADIKDLVSPGMPKEDSIKVAKKYIDSWVLEMLILNKAKSNLAGKAIHESIDKQIESYRNSLITHAYEEELVRQKLDTLVSDEEIERYFEQNKSNFELRNNIVKVRYIKASRKAPDLGKVRAWHKSDDAKDREQLQSYCLRFAENFYLDDNTWLLFDELKKEIPIETYNEEHFLKNNRFIELQDSLSIYFVYIKGFMVKNTTSPLSFEKENIRSIIINKRKLELIDRMKKDIYRYAFENKEFDINTGEKKL